MTSSPPTWGCFRRAARYQWAVWLCIGDALVWHVWCVHSLPPCDSQCVSVCGWAGCDGLWGNDRLTKGNQRSTRVSWLNGVQVRMWWSMMRSCGNGRRSRNKRRLKIESNGNFHCLVLTFFTCTFFSSTRTHCTLASTIS